MAYGRPLHDVRKPRHLDNFLLSPPRSQLPLDTLHDHSTKGATSPHPHPVITHQTSVPQHVNSEAVLSALQEMREDKE